LSTRTFQGARFLAQGGVHAHRRVAAVARLGRAAVELRARRRPRSRGQKNSKDWTIKSEPQQQKK